MTGGLACPCNNRNARRSLCSFAELLRSKETLGEHAGNDVKAVLGLLDLVEESRWGRRGGDCISIPTSSAPCR